jgi:hypothetical protein
MISVLKVDERKRDVNVKYLNQTDTLGAIATESCKK